MKTLRIAIIDPVGKKAGMDHYDISLASALIKKSCLVKVYSNFSTGTNASIIMEHFRFKVYRNWIRIIKLVVEFNSALQKAKKDQTEIVLLHVFHSSLIDYFFIRLTKVYGFNVCIIIHDIESLLHSSKRSRIKNCVLHSDKIIVHTEIAYHELINKTGMDNSKKVFVIPHGNFIDLPPRSDREMALLKTGLDPSHRYIIFFGMIKESKGLDVLIQAMSKVSGYVHLIIAGRTRDLSFNHYQQMIDKSGITARVHSFIRYITNEERNHLMSAADLAVLPYKRIYQSGVILMAMSLGLTVVTSDLHENNIFVNGNQVALFSAGNPDDLASRINELMADEEMRKNISGRALEYVTLNHNWEKIADLFIKALDQ
jgi:glycosyltransferase involved in cell wall biosynthesis